jgi:2-polyprenyl-3-methyl-5-hydroxy-6-metoxy-1,4-benzoquinol methylase
MHKNINKKQPVISELSRRRKLSLMEKYLTDHARILEVGSSDGWLTSRLRKKGFSVVSIDIMPGADIVGDILQWREIGLKEHSFDATVALEVIEHVNCLNALKSLCAPDGLIILSSPHPKWDWVMKILELFHLTQRRTSPHINLTDFNDIDLQRIVFKRPLYIHQFAIFRNGEVPG